MIAGAVEEVLELQLSECILQLSDLEQYMLKTNMCNDAELVHDTVMNVCRHSCC